MVLSTYKHEFTKGHGVRHVLIGNLDLMFIWATGLEPRQRHWGLGLGIRKVGSVGSTWRTRYVFFRGRRPFVTPVGF